MVINEDKEISESAIEGLAESLRSTQPVSEFHKQKWVKLIKMELLFLKVNFPESEILKQDFSDITG